MSNTKRSPKSENVHGASNNNNGEKSAIDSKGTIQHPLTGGAKSVADPSYGYFWNSPKNIPVIELEEIMIIPFD